MKNIFITVSVLLFVSCGSGKQEAANASADKPATAQSNRVDPPKKQSAKSATFKLNGVAALAATRSDEEPGAQLNAVNDYFSLFVYGDISSTTKRGMLSITSKNFKPGTGAISNARANFTRYLDAHGGKLVVYGGQEGKFSLVLSKCEQLPRGPVGDEWLISGTFGGELSLLPIYESLATEKTLQVTEGNFTDIKLIVLGRKK